MMHLKVGNETFDTTSFLSDGLIAFLTSVSTQFGEQDKINEDLQQQLKEQMNLVKELRRNQNEQQQAMENMKKESDEKFENVNDRMSEFELKNENLTKSIHDLENSSNEMKQKLNDISAKQEAAIDALKQSAMETGNHLDKIGETIKNMQKDIVLKKADNDEMNEKLQNLKSKVSAQNNAIVQLRSAIVASKKVEINDGPQSNEENKDQNENMELQMDALKDMMIEPFDDSKLETKIAEIETHINENETTQNEKLEVMDKRMSSLVDTVSRLDVARKKMLNNMSILNDRMMKLQQNKPANDNDVSANKAELNSNSEIENEDIANELSFSDKDIDDESERISANVSQSIADFSNGLEIEQLNGKFESLMTQFDVFRSSTNAQYDAIKVSNQDLEHQCKSLQEAIQRNEQNSLLRAQSKGSSKFSSRKSSHQSSFEAAKSEKASPITKSGPDNGRFLAIFDEWNLKIQRSLLHKKSVDEQVKTNLDKMEKKLEINIQNILCALSTKTDVNEFEETMQKLVDQINERLTNMEKQNDVTSEVIPSTESKPKIEQIEKIMPQHTQKVTVSMVKKPQIKNSAMLNKLSKKADVEQFYALQQQMFNIQGAIKKMEIDREHLSKTSNENARTIRLLKNEKNKVRVSEIRPSRTDLFNPPHLEKERQESVQYSTNSLNRILQKHKKWISQNSDHISSVSLSVMQANDLISKLRNDGKVKTSVASPSRKLLRSRGCAVKNDKDELPLLLDCIALELQNKANKKELSKKLNRSELPKLKQSLDEDVGENAYLSGRQFWRCVSCDRKTIHLRKEKEYSYQLPVLSISTRARVQFNKTPPPQRQRQRGSNVVKLQRLNASMQALDHSYEQRQRPQTTPFVEKVRNVQPNSTISIKW